MIIPEKNLKRLTLEANGMYSNECNYISSFKWKKWYASIWRSVKENEIEDIADYVMISAENNFEN